MLASLAQLHFTTLARSGGPEPGSPLTKSWIRYWDPICDNGKNHEPPLTSIVKFQQLNSDFSYMKLSQELSKVGSTSTKNLKILFYDSPFFMIHLFFMDLPNLKIFLRCRIYIVMTMLKDIYAKKPQSAAAADAVRVVQGATAPFTLIHFPHQ